MARTFAEGYCPMRFRIPLLLVLSWGLGTALAASPTDSHFSKSQVHKENNQKKTTTHAHRKQKGKASYYSREFTGKTTASGTPMDPDSNMAASKTLPLGTKAKVKNLRTGKTAVVKIKDRGPVPKGRVVDLSPKTAEKLDMKDKGVAPVEVTPLSVPKSDQDSAKGNEGSSEKKGE